MNERDTLIAYFAPRDLKLSKSLILRLGYDVLELRYLPHDIAWKCLKYFVEESKHEYVLITVDDVLVYRDNIELMKEAHEILGDKVISALMPLGMGLAGSRVWFSVTDKVLDKRPIRYADYDLWDIREVERKYRETRFHRVFYTGFGFTLIPKEVLEILPCEGMARYPSRVFGYFIRRPMQIDVRHSIELWRHGIEHYVDLMNIVNHLGNLRDLVPTGLVEPKVIFYERGTNVYDITNLFPIDDMIKRILVRGTYRGVTQ